MLTFIKIKNINSIDQCEIDFLKEKYKYLEDNLFNDCVNPIAIYGHNGSGKSSFLRAIGQFINLLTLPVDNLAPFVVNQFKLNRYSEETNNELKNNEDITGSIELHFILNNINYEYFLSVSRLGQIEKEYLKGNTKIFKRSDKNENYKGHSKAISQLRSKLIPTIRYLASEEVNDNEIQSVYKFLTSFTFVDSPKQALGPFVASKFFFNVSKYDLIVNKSKEVKTLLKGYNEFPVYDVLKKEGNVANYNSYYVKYDGIDSLIPVHMLSDGMLNQSTLLSILVSLPDYSVLFVDELDQALHPSAIMSFLNVVKRKKIQLVFSSQNTYVLQNLRPDQIFFARWKNGSSTLLRLSKIYPNIREVNNIEKMYLSMIFDEAIKNA